MRVCQISIKKNHNTKAINQQLRQRAIIAVLYFGKQNVVITARKGTFVLRGATVPIAERLCHLMNNHHGEVVSAIQKLIRDGRRKILNEWHFSKLEGMPEKRGQKGNTLLGNGKLLNSNTKIAVQFAVSGKNLLKTISFLYQRVALIISQIFNLYAVIAIAVSGNIEHNYFNIHENPELMGGNSES